MNRAHITYTDVTKRVGWSRALMKRLLGAPDAHKKIAGRSIPAALYAIDRIEQIEAGDEFRTAKAAQEKRRESARKAAEAKTAQLWKSIHEMTISVEQMSLPDVKARAIESYNAGQRFCDYASINDNSKLIARLTVDFIRRELTEYDKGLLDVAKRLGISFAVLEITKRVYAAISKAYPAFADECTRQQYAKLS